MLRFYFQIGPGPFIRRACIGLFIANILFGCSDSSDSPPGNGGTQPEPRYSALIERTEYGTAHITADDWGSLGFGQGYAFAQDRFCVLADQLLKVRSQRARYLGPGKDNEHLTTDFAYLALGVMEKADTLIGSLSEENREILAGYVAG